MPVNLKLPITVKPIALPIVLLSLAAFGVGCDREPSTSRQLDKAKTETMQATRDMKDYTFAQKAEFKEKMKEELDAIHNEVDQLAARIESSS